MDLSLPKTGFVIRRQSMGNSLNAEPVPSEDWSFYLCSLLSIIAVIAVIAAQLNILGS